MKWKVGDKVRLTGREWGTDEKDSIHVGAELRVTGVDDGGHVRLGKGRYHWGIYEGWEIELVEREEETMGVDLSEVNVGDKVRLTRENGDEATFTVTATSPKRLESGWNTYWVGADGDTLEIVERAFKLVPGLYSNHESNNRFVLLPDGREYFTSAGGSWIAANSSDEYSSPYQAVREQDGWGREVSF